MILPHMKRRSLLARFACLSGAALMTACGSSSSGPGDLPTGSYDTMVIEPIETSFSPSTSPVVAEQLAADYHSALRSVFSKRYRLTGSPGPNTLHLRAYLSDGSGSPTRSYTSPALKLQGALGPATAAVSATSFRGEITNSAGRVVARSAGQSLGSSGQIETSTHWMVPRSLAEKDVTELSEKLP